MPRKPKINFDFAYISGLDDPEASLEIYILSEPSQRVLDSLARMVEWPTRWYESGQRLDAAWDSRDDVRELATRIKGELSVPAHLDDLVAAIEGISGGDGDLVASIEALAALEQVEFDDTQIRLLAIEAAIKALRSADGLPGDTETPGGGIITPVGLADGPLTPDDVPYDADNPPITPLTDPNDDGVVSAEEWNEFRCRLAQYIFQSVLDWLKFTRTALEFGWAAESAIRWIVERIALALIPGFADDVVALGLDELFDLLKDFYHGGILSEYDAAIDALENIREQAVCDIAQADTATLAYDALYLLLTGALADVGDGITLAYLGAGPLPLIVALAWTGVMDPGTWADCDCAEDDAPDGYRLAPVDCANVAGSLYGTNNITDYSIDCVDGAVTVEWETMTEYPQNDYGGNLDHGIHGEEYGVGTGIQIEVIAANIPGESDVGRITTNSGHSYGPLEGGEGKIYRSIHSSRASDPAWIAWRDAADVVGPQYASPVLLTNCKESPGHSAAGQQVGYSVTYRLSHLVEESEVSNG